MAAAHSHAWCHHRLCIQVHILVVRNCDKLWPFIDVIKNINYFVEKLLSYSFFLQLRTRHVAAAE